MVSLREIKTDFQNNHITICILLRESKKRVHQILFSAESSKIKLHAMCAVCSAINMFKDHKNK